MKFYFNMLSQWKNLSDKTTRKDFWIFTTINFLFSFSIFFLLLIIGATMIFNEYIDLGIGVVIFAAVTFLLFNIVFSFSILVRRIRDFGGHPALVILGFLPWVGFVSTVVFGLLPSEKVKLPTKPMTNQSHEELDESEYNLSDYSFLPADYLKKS